MEWVLLDANRGVNRPLAALLRWWIQRQVTQAEAIQVVLQGALQVWRSGCLPYVQVRAQRIIYRDMHLEAVDLIAQNMRFHLPFLQKSGEPFLEPLTAQIQARITEANVNHSLPYLHTILHPYLRKLFPEVNQIQDLKIHAQHIHWWMNPGGEYITQVRLVSPQTLMLIGESDQRVLIDLGTDVQIQTLTLQPGAVNLSGNLIIRPEAPAA